MRESKPLAIHFLLALIIPLQINWGPLVKAGELSSIDEIANKITVRIEGATKGSGIIVSRNGSSYTVLTAWHVLRGHRPGEELAIITADGYQHPLKQRSIERIGKIDMALLTFESDEYYELAKLGDSLSVRHQHKVHVGGYPLSNDNMMSISPGEIIANAEVCIDQGYQLLYSNRTSPGMSGGPVLTEAGQLVGIHGRGEKSEQSTNGAVANLKTGVNQGVPIHFYKSYKSGEVIGRNRSEPHTADDYLAMAQNSIDIRGREQTVIRLSKKAAELRDNPWSHLNIGTAYRRIGNIDNAIQSLGRVLKFQNSYVSRTLGHVALIDIGNLFLVKQRPLKAIEFFTMAENENKYQPLAFMNRGFAYVMIDNIEGAIRDYSVAIKLLTNRGDPAEYLQHTYLKRAFAYYQWGDASKQCSDIRKALSIETKKDDSANLLEAEAWINSDKGLWCKQLPVQSG